MKIINQWDEPNLKILSKNSIWLFYLILLIIMIVIYLPNISNFGFYTDDWWQIYGAETYGPQRFIEMYKADRPFRAYLQAPLFSLFGSNILPYQILALGMRWLGAVGLFWLLSLIWRKHTKEIFLMSLLFMIYPGFLEQPNGYDYMAHQVAITLMVFSLGLSIKFYYEKSFFKKVLFLLFSGVLSLVTFLLMEFYLGMEVYRWLLLGYLQIKTTPGKIKTKILPLIGKILPLSFPAVGFAIWRIFIFQSTRYTTNFDRITTDIMESPLLNFYNIFRAWFGDLGDIYFSIWTNPGYQSLSDLRGREFLIAIILAIICVSIVIFVFRPLIFTNSNNVDEKNWALEAATIGFLGAIICLIPINFANRNVSFPIFNRFALPSSIGVSISFIAIISYLIKQKWQNILFSLLIFSSVLIQHTNNNFYANRWIETKKLWQQWVTRAPSLEKETVLVGFYSFPIQESYFIWAPANLLYYYGEPKLSIGAEVLNEDTIRQIEMNDSASRSSRSFKFDFGYSNTLVFSKPTEKNCLRFIDQNQIELSLNDNPLIAQVAQYSHIEKILLENKVNQEIYSIVFKQSFESDDWCYFYEKASLARQNHDWQGIINLFDQAEKNDLKPYDHIEWFPFLQAFAYLDMEDELNQLVPIIIETPYYRFQVCQIFSNKEHDPDPTIQLGNQKLAQLFCD